MLPSGSSTERDTSHRQWSRGAIRVPLRLSLILPASDSTRSAEYVRAQVLADRRAVVRTRKIRSLVGLQARYDDLRAVVVVVSLGAGSPRNPEVPGRSEFVQIYADADFLGVARAGSPDFGDESETGGGDVEAHSEQPEAAQRVVAGPTRLDRVFEGLNRHPGPVVLDGDASGVVVGAREGDSDVGVLDRVALAGGVKEAVDGIVDELGEAAPLVEVDLAQHLQDSGVGSQV